MDLLEMSFLDQIPAEDTKRYLTSFPFSIVDGAANFRDLGNLEVQRPAPTDDTTVSLKTRTGRVYRSAQLSLLRPPGVEKIHSLGITTVFDLRSSCELSSYGAPLAKIPNVEVLHVPVLPDEAFSPEEIQRREALYEADGEAGLLDEYMAVLQNGGAGFGTIFKHIRDNPDSACLIHCAIGKDRTGIFAALLLMLVGVSDDAIAHDYALTRVGLEPARPHILAYMTHYMKASPRVCAAMMTSNQSTMHKTLHVLRTQYGGAEGYLTNICGMKSEDLEIIRNWFIVSDDPPVPSTM